MFCTCRKHGDEGHWLNTANSPAAGKGGGQEGKFAHCRIVAYIKKNRVIRPTALVNC
jgi:hypothetical protein